MKLITSIKIIIIIIIIIKLVCCLPHCFHNVVSVTNSVSSLRSIKLGLLKGLRIDEVVAASYFLLEIQ